MMDVTFFIAFDLRSNDGNEGVLIVVTGRRSEMPWVSSTMRSAAGEAIAASLCRRSHPRGRIQYAEVSTVNRLAERQSQ
jgi:hypothetical protein